MSRTVLVFCVVSVSVGLVLSSEDISPSRRTFLEKFFRRNKTEEVGKNEVIAGKYQTNKNEVGSGKYPTATWSSQSYEEMKKEMSKLYLFKPSPFLKPPFTEGDVGAAISGIEDGLNVNGRLRGKIKFRADDTPMADWEDVVLNVDMTTSYPITTEKSFEDRLLEQSLMKYLRSSNLTHLLGLVTVDEFSEALMKLTEGRKTTAKPYENNMEMRRKFRDEMLSPKKSEEKQHGGILEKHFQRRLQKTWGNGLPLPVLRVLNTTEASTTAIESSTNATTVFTTTTTTTVAYVPPTSTTSATTINEKANLLNAEPPTNREQSEPSQSLDARDIFETARSGNFFDQSEKWAASQSSKTSYFSDSQNKFNDLATTIGVASTSRPTTLSTSTYLPSSSVKPTKSTKVSRGSKKWRDTVSESEYRRTMEEGVIEGVKINQDKATMLDDGEVQLSVAETVYYRPRQVPLNTFRFEHERIGSIPGDPEIDYPMLSTIPQTNFKCPDGISDAPRMLADRKARCQVFYVCSGNSPPSPMLCPNGTMFNEDVLVCDWWFNVDC